MNVFVYGSLRPGEWGAARLGPAPKYHAAVVNGTLGRCGELYGAKFDTRGSGVPGFVVEVDDETLASLTRFEGGGYDLVYVLAYDTGNSPYQCRAFQWNDSWGELMSLERWSWNNGG